MKMIFENWKKEILIASQERENEGQFNKFVDLVEMLDGKEGIEVLRVLMKTFSDKPDYGTQECVNRIMLLFPPELVARAILEDLPRLQVDGIEKAEALLEEQMRFYPDSFIKMANEMNTSILRVLKRILYGFLNNSYTFEITMNILKQLKD